MLRSGKFDDSLFINKTKRSDNRISAIKQRQRRSHGAHDARIANINKKCLNNIVFMVTKGNFVAFKLLCDFKKFFSAQA